MSEPIRVSGRIFKVTFTLDGPLVNCVIIAADFEDALRLVGAQFPARRIAGLSNIPWPPTTETVIVSEKLLPNGGTPDQKA